MSEIKESLADDREVIANGCETQSPWRTSASPAASVDAPVMGAHSWPALADAQQPRLNYPPPAASPSNTIPTSISIPNPAQAVGGQAKSTPGGKANPPPKNSYARHSKPARRNNQYGPPPPPLPPPYLVHAGPYHQPSFPPMWPLPQTTYPDSQFAFYPAYSIHSTLVAESSYENHFQAPPLPPVLPAPQEGPGLPWQRQRGFDPHGNMPQGAGPMNSMRPPYMNSAPTFMGRSGPGFPGRGYPPPRAIRDYPHPQFAPYPVNQGPPVLSPENLRDRLKWQIEYYFSDENLKGDKHLKSLMDGQGWVPTKSIATFNRVKSMTSDLKLIASALGSSKFVEVQGDKMRQRNEWQKWVPASKRTFTEEKFGDSNKDSSDGTSSRDNSRNPSNDTLKPDVCDCSLEGDQSSRTNNYQSDILESSSAEQRNVDVLSNDLSKTILLDKERDMEHISPKKSGPSVSERFEDEDNDIAVDDDDQDIQRLVIVTQNGDDNRINETRTNEEDRSVDDFQANDSVTSQKENNSH